MYDPTNVFARIIRSELPCFKVFENEHVIAFLDAFPTTPGHTLVIPKVTGFTDMFDLPEEAASQLGSVLPKVCRAVRKATGCDAVNIIQNCGPASGQAVPHPHFHIIPRVVGDQLLKHPASSKSMIDSDTGNAMAEKIRASL